MKQLGDVISSNPVVHAIGKVTGCVDPETNDLRPESGCAKRRDILNDWGNAIYDELFQPKKPKQQKE